MLPLHLEASIGYQDEYSKSGNFLVMPSKISWPKCHLTDNNYECFECSWLWRRKNSWGFMWKNEPKDLRNWFLRLSSYSILVRYYWRKKSNGEGVYFHCVFSRNKVRSKVRGLKTGLNESSWNLRIFGHLKELNSGAWNVTALKGHLVCVICELVDGNWRERWCYLHRFRCDTNAMRQFVFTMYETGAEMKSTQRPVRSPVHTSQEDALNTQGMQCWEGRILSTQHAEWRGVVHPCRAWGASCALPKWLS